MAYKSSLINDTYIFIPKLTRSPRIKIGYQKSQESSNKKEEESRVDVGDS